MEGHALSWPHINNRTRRSASLHMIYVQIKRSCNSEAPPNMKINSSIFVYPSPHPSPAKGRGGSFILFSPEHREKNYSLAPPGERVRVRGILKLFLIKDPAFIQECFGTQYGVSSSRMTPALTIRRSPQIDDFLKSLKIRGDKVFHAEQLAELLPLLVTAYLR